METKTIINTKNIDKVIIMWRKMEYLTINSQKTYLRTIEISADKSIRWNDIRGKNNLQFKTVDIRVSWNS